MVFFDLFILPNGNKLGKSFLTSFFTNFAIFLALI